MASWIDHVPYPAATGKLKRLYDRVKGPDNNVDNIMLAHSLRPHTMEGHMTLYKNVLHHSQNALPKWYLEALGTAVSEQNGCEYCREHHLAGMLRLLEKSERKDTIAGAVACGALESAFDDRERAGLAYARKLTAEPAKMCENDVEALRAAGFDDGEVLEINQVVAYFAYANRMVLGLGVDTDGDIVGLSPGDSSDPDNWSHG